MLKIFDGQGCLKWRASLILPDLSSLPPCHFSLLISCFQTEILLNLVGAGVFGDSLGALGDSMLDQLEEAHGSLDLPGGDGGALLGWD